MWKRPGVDAQEGQIIELAMLPFIYSPETGWITDVTRIGEDPLPESGGARPCRRRRRIPLPGGQTDGGKPEGLQPLDGLVRGASIPTGAPGRHRRLDAAP